MRRSPSSLFLGVLLALWLPSAGLCQVAEPPLWFLVTDVSCQPEVATTGEAVSNALREGLAGIDGVQLIVPGDLERILEAMDLSSSTSLTGTLAQEVAVRGGIPLMLEVELVPDGSAYGIETRLMDPENGTVHLRTTETASSEVEVPEAVARTVTAVRQGLEDTVPSVTNRQRLSLVFTPSLEALKLHTEAVMANQATRYADALPLLEEAVRVDPDFAAGWRLLSVVLSNLGQERERQVEAVTRAYELSRELPEYERLTTAATYFGTTYDYGRSAEVLEQITERFPDRGGWNNMGLRYGQIGEYEKARDALQEAVNRGPSALNTGNLITAAVRIGDLETAREALRIREDNGYGTPAGNLGYAATIAYMDGDREEARRLNLAGIEAATTDVGRATDLRLAGYLDAVEGRVASFHQRLDEANGLWSAAGSTGTVFDNRQIQALFDALVLGKEEEATARLNGALQDAASADAPRDRFDAGTLAFFGMPERAREMAAEWEAATPADLQALYEPTLHRLRGFLALGEGRVEEGMRGLEAAVEAGFESPINLGELAVAYDRAGMPDRALETFHKYLDAPNVSRRTVDAVFLGLTYERLGQLHEARGEVDEAVKFHTLFVDLWAEADPELQPRVQAAREALARLGLETATSFGSS